MLRGGRFFLVKGTGSGTKRSTTSSLEVIDLALLVLVCFLRVVECLETSVRQWHTSLLCARAACSCNTQYLTLARELHHN